MDEIYTTSFDRAVIEVFGAICAEFGFSITHRSALFVKFENATVRFIVAQRQIWDQLEFEIGLKDQEDLFSLDDIFAWNGADRMFLQIGDIKTLRHLTSQVADFIRARAEPLLKGDNDAFKELAAVSRARTSEYNTRLRVEPIVAEARIAWSSRDYGKVFDLLSAVKVDLDPSERSRLRLAAKYLENGKS